MSAPSISPYSKILTSFISALLTTSSLSLKSLLSLMRVSLFSFNVSSDCYIKPISESKDVFSLLWYSFLLCENIHNSSLIKYSFFSMYTYILSAFSLSFLSCMLCACFKDTFVNRCVLIVLITCLSCLSLTDLVSCGLLHKFPKYWVHRFNALVYI